VGINSLVNPKGGSGCIEFLKVLMIPHNTSIAPTTEKNVIKVATKKYKDKLYSSFKREGIDDANVIKGKRRK
jgi:hypothetical protein